MTERVFILGAGRAGRSLARALRASGGDVVGLHGRHATEPEAGVEVTVGRLPADRLTSADVAIVTVQDAALDGALGELLEAAESGALRAGAAVLHASGGAEPAALDRLRSAGHPSGTFHPLVALADPARGPALLRGAWIGVDGDDAARACAARLAERLGARVLRIPPGSKPRYHAAAVFAANFPVVLAELSLQLMRAGGVEEEAARGAVSSLMAGALGNLAAATPAEALTGPIVRGDAQTIERHLAALAADPATRDCYVHLSRVALSMARERGSDGERLEEIGRVLGA